MRSIVFVAMIMGLALAALAQQSGAPQPSATAVVITMTRFGFRPAAITVPKGKLYLIVENRSRVPDVLIHLDDNAANHLSAVPLHLATPDHTDSYSLQPGQYKLTEAGHPKWSCVITVSQ